MSYFEPGGPTLREKRQKRARTETPGELYERLAKQSQPGQQFQPQQPLPSYSQGRKSSVSTPELLYRQLDIIQNYITNATMKEKPQLEYFINRILLKDHRISQLVKDNIESLEPKMKAQVLQLIENPVRFIDYIFSLFLSGPLSPDELLTRKYQIYSYWKQLVFDTVLETKRIRQQKHPFYY